MTRRIWFVAACGLLMAANGDDPSGKAHARLEGVWSFALVEVEGKKQPDVPFATHKMIILKDGRYVVVQGPRVTHGVVKVDPAKTPGHYDVTVTSGPVKGLMVAGIYALEGDTLKLCLPLRGKERPTGFDSKPGSGQMVQVFKREGQGVADALAEAGRKELAGTWQAVTYALDGNKASDEDMKKVQLVIDADGKTEAKSEGKVFIASMTRINPAQDPMTMDITFTVGKAKGKMALAIYKIENDVLTICRGDPGQARPTEYASTPGSGHTLMTYRRDSAGAR